MGGEPDFKRGLGVEAFEEGGRTPMILDLAVGACRHQQRL
jgi:hypothetical protein